MPAVTTVIVDENKVYHFDIGYHKYTNIADDAAVLVLFDENNKVLTAVPWAEGGFLDKYLVFTSEVKKYGVTYNVSPAIKPYPSIYNETYEIQDINDVISSMNTEIEANTASISAVEGNINTQQGNRALYVAAGAVYNEQTGFYELNGLTDITEAQMRNIYVFTIGAMNLNDFTQRFNNLPIRTNIPVKTNPGGYYLKSIIGAAFALNTTIETINLSSIIYPDTISYAFDRCSKLKTIMTIIDLRNHKISTDVLNTTFRGCLLLENVKIMNLHRSIEIKDSPLISLESLQYLITNADNTSAITVTVHADVYAKIQDESQADWHALIEAATAKQITLATA